MVNNILYLSRTSNFGGAEISLLDLITRIDKAKYHPIVFLPDKKGLFYKRLIENNIEVIIKKTPFLRKTINPLLLIWFFFNIIFFNFYFLSYISIKKIKIVVCNSFQDSFFVIFATKVSKSKLLIYIKNILDKNWKKYIRAKICQFFADYVIAISKKNAEDFTKYSNKKDKIYLIYDGIDVDKFKNVQVSNGIHDNYVDKCKDSFKIINIGNISELKGQKLLAEAIMTDELKNKNLKVFFIGEAFFKRDIKYRGELLEYINKNKLEHRVFLLGFQNNIGKFINQSDLLVHCPIIEEGLGMVVLEAFSLHKMVIATNIGGIPEMIKDGYNGFLCLPDKDSLAEKISYVLSNKDNLGYVADNAKKVLKENFSLSIKIKKTEKIYKSLLSDK
jgi:glycosyltransferase involved in cell wall biosynthesis